MRVVHEIGKYVAVEQDGIERVRYNYQLSDDPNPSAPKPFCHPIRTSGGHVVTAASPLDHLWHRGVWFTWKFVNGVNYWEENEPIIGRQVTLLPPVIDADNGPDDAVHIWSFLEWRDRKNGTEEVRLQEERTVAICLYENGAMTLDWHIVQTAVEEVVLDRTPYTTWGGYSGIVARTTQGLHKQSIVFDDGSETNRPTGESHRWGGLQGQLDEWDAGWVSVVLMPSPQNRRFPEPFYGTAKPFFNFFGPAPLFHEPLTLRMGETLHHATRVLILPRAITAAEVNGYYEDWCRAEAKEETNE